MKNFKPIAGKSLVQRACEQALESGCADRVIISTDEPALAQSLFPRQVIVHKRRAEAACDSATAIAVIQDILFTYSAEAILYLQPTSPLRTARDIAEAWQMFKTGNFDSVVSVAPLAPEAHFALKIDGRARADFLFPDSLASRTQDLPPVYKLNGAIYISSPENLARELSFTKGRVGAYVMKASQSLDIDTEEDWWAAERRLSK